MATFLDDISNYNAKAAKVIMLLSLKGDSEQVTLFSSLKTTANDLSLTDAVRLNALTALINAAGLLDTALPPYFPVTTTYANQATYIGLHNDLSGLNVGDYLHLTAAEYTEVLNKASLSDITFGNLIGNVSDNTNLANALSGKQDVIPGGSSFQFYGWDKTMRPILFSYIQSTPSTLAGYGISASDTLFDGKYLSYSSLLTGFSTSSASAILATDTIVQAFGKAQAQINGLSASAGTVISVGLLMPTSTFSVSIPTITSSGIFNVSFISQTANKILASPDGANGTPSFRSLASADLPVTGVTPGSYGSSSALPVITVDVYGRITSITTTAAVTGGTVTSVGLSVPYGFVGSGTYVTTTGNLSFDWDIIQPNQILAGPAVGPDDFPLFRSLVAADIPSIAISQVIDLQSSLDAKLDASLNDGEIWIGSIANGPVNKSLTQDVTMTREGVVTISNGVVTFAKMQDVNTQVLLGRYTAGIGSPQQVGLSADFVLDNISGILSLAVPVAPILDTKGSLITYRASVGTQVQLYAGTNGQLLIPNNALDDGLAWVDMSGDAFIDYAGAVTIQPGVVSLSKMSDLAGLSIIGNNTLSPATPIALTGTDVTALLDIFTDTTNGLVPTPGSALPATYYLDATGGWTIPAGGGGGGGSPAGATGSVQYNNAGAFGGTSAIWADGANAYVTDSKFAITDNAFTPTDKVIFSLASVSGTDTWLFPNGGDTFAGTTLIQDLTNKTLKSGTAIDLGSPDIGDIYYSNDTAGTLASLPAGPAGNVLISGGISVAPSWGLSIGSTTISSTITIGGGSASIINIGGGATATELRFLEPSASGTNYTAFKAQTQSGNITYTLPAADGTSGQFLSTNASGLLSWATAGSGSGTINTGVQFAVPYYTTAGTTLDDITPPTTNGTYVLTSVVSASTAVLPTWVAAGAASSLAFNLLTAAANTNAIDNTSFAQEWRWNSLVGATGLKLSSTSTAGTTGQTLFGVALSGINVTSSVTTYAATIANTHTGIGSVNYALSLSASGGATGLSAYGLSIATTGPSTTNYGISVSASGGTTNYAIDVLAGISRFAAGTASVPQLVLTPSSAIVPSGTVDGSIWYDTTANNSTIQLRKLWTTGTSVLTKVITASYNPDFATGSASGVIVADTAGTLTKSADLTALGVYSAYADVTVSTTTITSLISGSIVGSTTLPANFFAVGKTMRVLLVGTITCGANDDSTITLSIGASTQTFTVTDLPVSSAIGFTMELFYVCRTAGASSSVSVTGSFTLSNSAPQSAHVYVFPSNVISGFNSAVSQVFNIQNTWGQLTSTVVVQTNTAYYLN